MTSNKKLSCFIIVIILSLLLSVVANTSSEVLVAREEQQEKNDDIISGGGETNDDDTATNNIKEEQHVSSDNKLQQQQQQEENVKELPPTTSTVAAHEHEPPSHFQISAHIQTNLHTGLSYFLPLHETSSSSFAHIPFLECGAVGSTTATVPLVSGVFRHSPVMMSENREKEKLKRGGLEFLEGGSFLKNGEEEVVMYGEDSNHSIQDAFLDDDGETNSSSNGKQRDTNGPKRPSPPTYVVALSPLEITVGGNGNETQQFNAGDVIFFEDTWLGIWDDIMMDNYDEDYDETNDNFLNSEEKVKGYTMRASSESRNDMNVIMLTIPPALHRQWKHRHERQQQQKQEAERSSNMVDNEVLNKSQKNTKPWWKLSSLIIKRQQLIDELPKPCSLESDPAFAHPSISVPTTLSQHFSQHFTNLLRQFHQPFHLSLSSSSNDNYDLILPIFAQTAAATVGGATAFAGVLHLLRTVNPTVAIGFGAACVIGFGTWGVVWLGEELLDEWEMWRERRRLERRMSESWINQ
eukprot:scaffold764_cov79-Skeletonema_menzelii.AAC.13